jgi:hypothetical protein
MRKDGKVFPVHDGILSIVYPETLVGSDSEWNHRYNWLAPYYDFSERFLGRLITSVDMVKGRREIVSHLEFLAGCRLLEVSPGPGVFHEMNPGYLKNILLSQYHWLMHGPMLFTLALDTW